MFKGTGRSRALEMKRSGFIDLELVFKRVGWNTGVHDFFFYPMTCVHSGILARLVELRGLPPSSAVSSYVLHRFVSGKVLQNDSV